MFCKRRKWPQLSLCLVCGAAALANCASSSAATATTDDAEAMQQAEEHYRAGLHCQQDGTKEGRIAAAEHFRAAAEFGHTNAMRSLGEYCMYEIGWDENRQTAEHLQTAIDYYRNAADRGSDYAKGVYAYYLSKGYGIPVNKALARHYFERAVDRQTESDYRDFLISNWGGYRDVEKAVHYFGLAAAQSYSLEKRIYGRHLLFGNGIPTDPFTAVDYFKYAADGQDAGGKYWYGWCLLHGVGIQQNLARGADYLQPGRAHYGYAPAQHAYLLCLANNIVRVPNQATEIQRYRNLIEEGAKIGPDQESRTRYRRLADLVAKIDTDPVVAASKLKQLADSGDADAQCTYGWCIIEGTGVCVDPIDAVDYFRLAADQGNADGQCCLGWCLINGAGVAQNQAAAVSLFKMAAAQENADALYHLGECFDAGIEVPQDRAEAVRLWELAATQGNPDAQYTLGALLLEGIGVEHNPAEAVDYLKMAAEQGQIHAKYALILCYSTGTGCEKDSNEADRLRLEVAQYRAYP